MLRLSRLRGWDRHREWDLVDSSVQKELNVLHANITGFLMLVLLLVALNARIERSSIPPCRLRVSTPDVTDHPN